MTSSTSSSPPPTKTHIHRSLTNTDAAIARFFYCRRGPLWTFAVIGMVLFLYGRSSIGAEEGPELQPANYINQRNSLWETTVPVCTKPNRTPPKNCVAVGHSTKVPDGTVCAPGYEPSKCPTYVVEEDAKHHFKLIAATLISGIEANRVDTNPIANYWDVAWNLATNFLKPTNTDFALAINSANLRDQDQLHIHMGCLKNDTLTDLKTAAATITTSDWKHGVSLSPNHQFPYDAIAVDDLSKTNPFSVLFHNDSIQPKSDYDRKMADQTVVVTKTGLLGGKYYILARASGSGQELLEDCPK